MSPLLRGINLFSHVGGMALGLSPWVETLMYTCSQEEEKDFLEDKMIHGHLSDGKIKKFSYNIYNHDLPPNVDIVFGLIHHFAYQTKEIMPLEQPTVNFLNTPEYVHLKSIREAVIIANMANAKHILLMFPYNPFYTSENNPNLPETILNIFLHRGYCVKCLKTPANYMLAPTERFYTLYASKTDKVDGIKLIENTEVLFKPIDIMCIPNTWKVPNISKTEEEENLRRGFLLWDIPPYVVAGTWQKLQQLDLTNDAKLQTIIESELPVKTPVVFDYTLINLKNIYDMIFQLKIISPLKLTIDNTLSSELEKYLGWPQGWTLSEAPIFEIINPALDCNVDGDVMVTTSMEGDAVMLTLS